MNYSVDEAYMRMALSIARDGLGRVWPNPSVGCVIVNNGVAVGYGHTADGGRPHAEAAALAMADKKAKGATVYVTLEPCAERGRDESCSDKLIAAQVSRVVVACHDPNPAVYKKGIAKLEAAGIKVDFGLYEKEAIDSHIGFFNRIQKNRPFICLKQAVSSNEMIAAAPGQRTQISSEQGREYLHLLRSTYDAIAVGIGTVLADDPLLTARVPDHEHSIVRIIFDSALKIPLDSQLVKTVQDNPVWVVYKNADEDRKAALQEHGVKLIESGACVSSAVHAIADEGITRLLVEGGAKLHHSFIEAGLYDEVQILRSTHALSDSGLRAAEFKTENLQPIEKRDLGEDSLEIYRRAL